MDVQWYPGHMTKARRMMQEEMKLVDLVLELIDARIPFSSKNPDIDELAKGKARVILLNKADLADDAVTAAWEELFKKKGLLPARINARTGAGLKSIQPLIQEACREKIERDRRRGILNRPVRAMVVGIPNVGKSTFINSFAGRSCTKTGNTPGVTKGKQWIRLNKQVELLDTPGILWPKFEDPTVGKMLSAVGSIREELILPEELALWLIAFLRVSYPDALGKRYGADVLSGVETGKKPDAKDVQGVQAAQNGGKEPGREKADPSFLESKSTEEENVSILRKIARIRSCLLKGNEPDLVRASRLLIDDFRTGKLGRISLETPET